MFVLKVVGVEIVERRSRTAPMKAKIKEGMQNALAILREFEGRIGTELEAPLEVNLIF